LFSPKIYKSLLSNDRDKVLPEQRTSQGLCLGEGKPATLDSLQRERKKNLAFTHFCPEIATIPLPK
jgi:hypothetical protein